VRPLPLRPGRVEAWPRRFWHTERPPQHYGLEESLGGRSDLGNQGHGTALVQQQLGSISSERRARAPAKRRTPSRSAAKS
jgi:hypothetical protein